MKFILVMLFLFGCTHGRHPHGSNSANVHMHQRDHKQLIQSFDDPARDLWQEPKKVMELIGNVKDLKVIDIGSGSGYFTKYFIQSDAFITAADVDEKFLQHIENSFPKTKFSKLTLSEIEFDDPKMGSGAYDIAFTSNTYHHIDDRATYLKKVKTGLKANGKLVILDFKSSPHTKPSFGPPLKMRVPLDVVVKELVEAGFNKIDINNQTLEHQYLVIAQ